MGEAVNGRTCVTLGEFALGVAFLGVGDLPFGVVFIETTNFGDFLGVGDFAFGDFFSGAGVDFFGVDLFNSASICFLGVMDFLLGVAASGVGVFFLGLIFLGVGVLLLGDGDFPFAALLGVAFFLGVFPLGVEGFLLLGVAFPGVLTGLSSRITV